MKDTTGTYISELCKSSHSRNARERGKSTKNIGVCALLALSAFCTVFNPAKASADTVTLTFENVGPGNQTDGYYTYPYNFSVNGSITYTSMMCLSFTNEIYSGESWTAEVYSIPAADALIGTSDYSVAAWLFNDAETATAATSNEDQLAAWGLFSSGVAGSDNAQLAAAEAAASAEPASAYNRFRILIPLAGTQSQGGLPQIFIEDPPPSITPELNSLNTPEPNSMVLLGSGLLGCVGFFCRKLRKAVPGRPGGASSR